MYDIKGIIFIHLFYLLLAMPVVDAYAEIPTTNDSEVTFDEDQIKTFEEEDFPFDDDDGHTLSGVKIITLPAKGELKRNGSNVKADRVISQADIVIGNIKYFPEANGFGDPYTSFEFSVIDSKREESSSATLTFKVNPVNDPPTIDPVPDPTAILEDAGLQTINLSGISAGPGETENLEVTVASTNTALINPSISYNSSDGTGTVTYSPAPNLSGSATVTVTVDDGDLSVQESWLVTVTAVNDPPTINTIPTQTTNEDQPITVPMSGISAGPFESGQTITITASSSNDAIVPDGVATYTPGSATGSITFTPVANASGNVTITVLVTDDGGNAPPDDNTTTITFQLQVQPVNDPPTLDAIANPAAIDENAGLQTINLSGITAGGNETQILEVLVSSSNIALIPTPLVSYTSPNSIGSISYTPAANQSGSSVITVTVRDNGTPVLSISRTFTVNVQSVNDPPTLDDLPSSPIVINEDAPIQTLLLTGISAGGGEVQTLTVTAVSGSPTIIPNPTIGPISGGQATLSYQPVANMNGNVTITVTVDDGETINNTVSKEFYVNVLPVNDPPTLSPVAGSPFTINEDAPTQSVNLAGISAGGGETQILSITAVSDKPTIIPNPTISYTQGATTALLTYIPLPDKSGTVTFTVTVDDLSASNNIISRTFVVNVQEVNDPPTINDIVSPVVVLEDAPQQSVALTGISAGAGDVQVVTVTALSSNTAIVGHPTVNYSGNNNATLLFTPMPNANGAVEIEVTVNDGQAVNNTVKKVFTIEVLKVNDQPTLDIISSPINILENTGLQTITITGITPGPNEAEQTVTITATSNNTTLIPNPTISPKTATSRDLTFTPVANRNGTATITVTVNDGQALNNTIARTFIVNVQAVNDPPTFNLNGGVAVTENSGPQTVIAQASAIDDGDPELTQALTFDLAVTGPVVYTTLPTLSVVTGNLTFETAPNSNGVSNVTVSLTDDGIPSQSTVKTFAINVLAVNGKPTFSLSGNPAPVDEDAGLQTVTAFATDINDGDLELNQTLTFTLTKVSGSLTFSNNPQINAITGNLTYQSAPSSNGTATFNVTLTDSGGEISSVQTITITVNPVNDPPVGKDEVVNTDEDVAYRFKSGDFTYTDPEFDAFSGIQIVSLETAGDLEYNGTDVILNQNCPNVALLVYKPEPNSIDPAEFSFKLIDSQGAASATYKMTITINSVADNPVSAPAEVNTSENVTYRFKKADFPFSDPDANSTFASVRIFSLETRGNLEYNGVDVVVGTEVTNFTQLRFIPAPFENGEPYATFKFQVRDNTSLLSTDYTMSIYVGSMNDRPIGANGKIGTLEDQPYTFKAGDFVFNDPDGDEFDGIRIESQATAGQLEYNGLVISDLPALCPDVTKLVFKPEANKNGIPYSTFTFKVKDKSSSLNLSSDNYTMTIDVTAVNDAPVFNIVSNPPAIDEDAGSQTIVNFVTSINDGDPEISQTVQFSNPEKISGTGNLTFQTAPKIDLAGTLTYQPAANTYGTAVFNVFLTDNGGTSNGGISQSQIKSFTIAVNAVNDRPTIAPIANRPPIPEDSETITVNLANITAGPLESQPLVVTAVSSNPGLIPHPTVNYTSPNTTGSISYKPVADQWGTAIITITVDDGDAFNGTVSISFSVTVTPVNDPPTINDIANPAPIPENAGEQIVAISGLSAGGGEDQDIIVTAVSSNVALIKNPLLVLYSGGTTAQVIYTPVMNQDGESTITVTVNDQNGGITAKSFKVTVAPVNDPPTLASISNPAPIMEDAAQQQITLSGISAGINENQVLTLSGTSSNTSLIQISPASFVYTSPNTTGTLRYQPIANRFGTTIITVSVSDGIASVSQQFTVEVKPVADTPGVTNASTNQGEQSTTGLVISRNPEDGNEVTYFKITNILNGKLYYQNGITEVVNGAFLLFSQANAGLRFTPSSTVNGSFEIQASLTNVDSGLGGAKAKATIFINTKPTTTDIPDRTVNEDSPQLVFDLYQAFSDKEDPDTSLKFTVTNTSPDLIKTTIVGQYLYVDLLPNKNGIAFLSITCEDTKGASVEDNIKITIIPVNDKPFFTSTPITSVDQDQNYLYNVITSDPENEQRSLLAAVPSWLVMLDKGDGTATLSGVPDQTQVGDHPVEITVRETVSGLSEKQIFIVTVLDENDAPEIVSTPPAEVNVADLYYYEIVVQDPDQGQGYTVQIDTATVPSWLVLSDNAPYKLEGVPPEGTEGVYSIKLTVTDAGGLSGEQVYQLTVLPANKRPTIGTIDAILINEDQIYSFTSKMFTDEFNDPDPGDQMEFITITLLPLNGSLMLNTSLVVLNDKILVEDLQKLQYKPNSNYSGLDFFYWNASDGRAMSLNTSIVSISINPVPDPPEILNMETEPVIFYFGQPALTITEEAEVYEYDNGLISFATVAITDNYNSNQDSLYILDYDGIGSNWVDSTGVLIISGIKNDNEYQNIIRSVRYINIIPYAPDSKKRTVTFIVSDGLLQSVPVSRDIIFEDTFVSLDIPNGFTPNGDGANDTWEIGNIDVHEDAIVRVFTRDGIQVYESKGYFKAWDGKYQGSVMKAGVYYYTIEIQKFERRFSGTITLLR